MEENGCVEDEVDDATSNVNHYNGEVLGDGRQLTIVNLIVAKLCSGPQPSLLDSCLRG